MSIAIIDLPSCYVINFAVKLIFIIKPFFLYEQKVMTKI